VRSKFLVFCFALFSLIALARVEIPALSNRAVIDEAGVLKPEQIQVLTQRLQAYREVAQIQVWLLKSLEGEPIESLSIRAVDQWKLGSEKDDNGALLLISLSDRRMRLEIGQGLEGFVPDVMAARIIDYLLAPQFREGRFYEGISAAVQEVYVRSGGKGVATDLNKVAAKKSKSKRFSNILFLLFFLFMMSGRLGLLGPAFLMSSGRRSGGWGGGGGGGWSGGGGGFSGGGSSGSW